MRLADELLERPRAQPRGKPAGKILDVDQADSSDLAGKKPQSGLLPTDERGRLEVTSWQFWDLAHWDPAVAILLIEKFVKPKIRSFKIGSASFHRARAKHKRF